MYRVAHQVADIGWVDLDFECSTVCPTLLGLTEILQKRLDKVCAGWWNTEIKVNQTKVLNPIEHLVE